MVYRAKGKIEVQKTIEKVKPKGAITISPKAVNDGLTIDLGHISPLSETNCSSPDLILSTPSQPSSAQSDILKDGIGPMLISDQDNTEAEDEEQKKNEEKIEEDKNKTFKVKLIQWIRENNLKLAPKIAGEIETNDNGFIFDPFAIANNVSLIDSSANVE